MIDRLQLSGNTQYFRVTKKLTNALISDCLDAAAESKIGHATKAIREQHNYADGDQRVSFILFKTEKLPSFMIRGSERDVQWCCALLVEIEGFLLVKRFGAADFSHLLDGHVKKIESSLLKAAHLAADSEIEQLTAQSIRANSNEVQKATYHGKKLQRSMPRFGASSKVLNNIKHKTGNSTVSVVPNSSRINFLGEKPNIEQFIAREITSIQKFDGPVNQNDFLDVFATELKLEDYVADLIPRELLFSIGDIVDFIAEKDNPAPTLYYSIHKRRRDVSTSVVSLLQSMESLFEIEWETKNGIPGWYITNDFDSSLRLEADGGRYLLKSEKFQHLILEFYEGDKINLQRLINQKQWFNISFNVPNIHYAAGMLCRDNRLLGNINSFLQMFVPDPVLGTITSEKGKTGRTSTGFPTNSLFHYVEARFKKDFDHLLLDDLGYEVSDYVGVKTGKTVGVIHCKSGNSNLSASLFQDVAGQVVKNLFFFKDIDAISGKLKLWRKNYSKTSILRVRTALKGHGKDLKDTLLSTYSNKEVILVVNFLSYRSLETELRKLKAGKQAKRSATPLLWLLSSLKNSCDEQNVKIHIYCKP